MELISTSELLEGMITAKPIISEKGDLILNHGVKITASLIKSLQNRLIPSIYILDRYTLQVDPIEVLAKEMRKTLFEEITRYAPDKKEANMNDTMVTHAATAKAIIGKILEDENVIKLCLNFKILDNDKFFAHAMMTCAFSLLVAAAMKLQPKEIYKIGVAALLHDLGVTEMPRLAKNKPETKQEEALWKEHSTYGYYLSTEGGIKEEIAKLILHHHEQWNGEGFPQQLKENDIPLGSRVICVCQTFDYLTRYENLLPYQAIEYLYGACGYLFDAEVVNIFTQNIAMYPMSSLVRLTTGETGVIVNIRKHQGPRPVIKLFYDQFNKPLAIPKEVDLGSERTVFIKEII